MKPTRLTLCLVAMLLIFPVTLITAQKGLNVRPYIRLGVLLTPPSTEDLGYFVIGDPGGLDDFQDISVLNYAMGVQLLKGLSEGPSIGGELGIQNLFNSVIDHGVSSLSDLSLDTDREWDVYLGPLVEFQMDNSPLYFQAGLGVHVVYWQYISEYDGTYVDEYYTDGGIGTSVGINGTAGFRLKISDSFSMPIALRTDVIFRHGILLQAGILVGLDFH